MNFTIDTIFLFICYYFYFILIIQSSIMYSLMDLMTFVKRTKTTCNAHAQKLIINKTKKSSKQIYNHNKNNGASPSKI